MQPHPLAELFPMLPESELRELADDIVTFGQRVPIVLLDGMVLDGRNRLAACRFAEVEPRFVEYEGDDPLNFVLSHNLHRRHLTESQRAMIAARIVDWDVGINQVTAGAANLPTRKAAERLSISERAVRAARRIQERGAGELVEAIREGRVTVHAGEALSDLEHETQREILDREEREIVARAKAIRAERQRRRHDERLENMRRIAGDGGTAAPRRLDRRYPVIYADPPWRFGVRSEVTGREKSAENHYPTMTTPEIAALFAELGDPATADAVLFLWAINPMLSEALDVMRAWGFAYVHHWIWDKEVAGTGYWGRDRHELLLIGRRGDVAAPLPGSQPETVRRERKGPHSAKPDFFAETIERLYPAMARLEMFARRARPGWDAWGYEAGDGNGGSASPPSVLPDISLSRGENSGGEAQGPASDRRELKSGTETGLKRPWFRPDTSGAEERPAAHAGDASQTATLRLTWHQAMPPRGRILAMAGPLEVGAIFPPAEAADGWIYSYWLGKVAGPHKRARTEAAARKAIVSEWAAFCAKAAELATGTSADA